MTKPLPEELSAELPLLPSHRNRPLNLSHRDLSSLDFSGRALNQVGFDASDLSESDLSGAILDDTSFDHSRLHRANLNDTTTHKTDFFDADCTHVSLIRARLWRSMFTRCQFQDANLQGATLAYSAFNDADFSRASLVDATLTGVQMPGVRLFQTRLTGCRVYNIRLAGARGISTAQLDWLTVGDDRFFARIERPDAIAWLESLTEFPARAAAYWEKHGMPWRTEPELHPVLQQRLIELRSHKSDMSFAGVALGRSALEWLIAESIQSQLTFDLRGIDIHGLDLNELPLRYIFTQPEKTPCLLQAVGTQFRYADFTGATLIGGNFRQSVCHHAILERADLSGSDFSDARLVSVQGTEAIFAQAQLTNARLAKAQLDQADFREADLRGATFARSSLRGADFRGALLDGADFTDADLAQARFS